jgi:DnaJ-class molecular chaperone
MSEADFLRELAGEEESDRQMIATTEHPMRECPVCHDSGTVPEHQSDPGSDPRFCPMCNGMRRIP